MTVNVALTGAVRANLLNLQSTNSDISRVQNILSTGKEVASAVDDASRFFRAKGIENRASDFQSVKTSIQQAAQNVKVALGGVEAITDLVEQLDGILNSARQTSDTTELTNLVTQYNEVRDQIDALTEDTEYNGTNLIKGSPDSLEVFFDEANTNSLSIAGAALDSAGLSVSAASDFSVAANITSAQTEVKAALNTLRSQAATFGTNSSILNIREQFTKNYVSQLEEGAGKLTLADLDEQGANLLALQTRQSLAISSLSLAAQTERSILQLIR